VSVKRYDYAAQFGQEIEPLISDIRRMLLEGHYILSEEVCGFESKFAKFLGVKHARGVNTGTDALVIALMALAIGPGDEVITQANTFHATVAAIRLAGARPVLVDADEDSFLIREPELEAAVGPATRAVIPVHLYGKPTPMDRLLKLAQSRGFHLIEDAAQAHGARMGGRAVGSFGVIGTFSFHPSKNLSAAGDGGAVVTSSDALDHAICLRRGLGQDGQNNHVVLGLNSKLDSLQARILSCKLEKLDDWNKRRRVVARWYRERLADLPLGFQSTDPSEEHVYHLFQVRTGARDRLLAHLVARGIDAVVRYPTPIHLQPAFRDCGWRVGQFPVAERLAKELLCLPIRPDMPQSEVDAVTEAVFAFFGR